MGDGYLHPSPSWILGKGGEKQDGESSPTRTDCKTVAKQGAPSHPITRQPLSWAPLPTLAPQSHYQHLGCCGREWLRLPGVGSFDFDKRNSWSLSLTSVLAMAPTGQGTAELGAWSRGRGVVGPRSCPLVLLSLLFSLLRRISSCCSSRCFSSSSCRCCSRCRCCSSSCCLLAASISCCCCGGCRRAEAVVSRAQAGLPLWWAPSPPCSP